MKGIGFVIAFFLLLQSSVGYAQQVEELQLPAIPLELREPQQRAGYIIEHFWDNINLADDARARDAIFMEQNFVNFLSVVPVADSETQQSAISTLMQKAETLPQVYDMLISLAEKYLYEPESPMKSDDIYRMFLDRILASDAVENVRKIRFRAQLHAVNQNCPGDLAADFSFLTPDATIMNLRDIDTKGEILLIFYDPDCDHCSHVMASLIADDTLTSKVEAGKLTVVAIYSGDEKELWSERLSQIPSNWIVGYEDGALQDDGRYVIRMMPTVYLLDTNKRVIAKELPADNLIEILNNKE